MNTVRLSNISIADFKAFLESKGCVRVDNGNEGHEKWEKIGVTRPIIFQSHIDPIIVFVFHFISINYVLNGRKVKP